ncbi:MAG: Gfo/Idh/MocA family oxidoreductase [Proteobacteria bacterium]|nr:Gfo/Idh/MocA family oxidoreductase [Pseudomonadota bacterium]
MKTFKVLVLGAGRIASGYDSFESTDVLTHCTTAFFDLDDCRKQEPDIVVICTPDHTHASFLESILDWRPLLVVCEKPLTVTLNESERLIGKYEVAQVPLAVVYQRRYDHDINRMREMIHSGALGAFLVGTLLYSKGLLHNGSHGLDLLIYLFGNILHAEYHSHRVDYSQSDPTVSGRLRFDYGDVYLLAADERCHSLFELDLVFEKGRFRLLDSGLTIEVQHVIADPVFPGYKALLPADKRPSTLNRALYSMWDRIAACLDTNTPLPTNAREALLSQKVCTELLQQAMGDRS